MAMVVPSQSDVDRLSLRSNIIAEKAGDKIERGVTKIDIVLHFTRVFLYRTKNPGQYTPKNITKAQQV